MDHRAPSVPDVSVIIPTHNRCDLLRISLYSVLRQRGVTFEVIVVDDGSTDDTAALLAGVRDPRVFVIRHDTALGVSGARNRGIDAARGGWVAFLDDDDLWAPDKLALQLDAARLSGRSWAYAGAVEITRDHRVLAGQPPLSPEHAVERLTATNTIAAGSSNVLVRKEWLPEGVVFDGRFHHSADWDLWLRLARQGPPAWVPKPLLAYRFHEGSASLDLEGMFAETDEIERRYGGPIDRAAYLSYLARLARRSGWRRRALHYSWRAARTGGSRYVTDFLRDARDIMAVVIRERVERYGLRLPRRPIADPHRSWKEAGRAWVDELVREYTHDTAARASR